jgi:hypothetical protein
MAVSYYSGKVSNVATDGSVALTSFKPGSTLMRLKEKLFMGDAARADDFGASPAALIDRALLRLAR